MVEPDERAHWHALGRPPQEHAGERLLLWGVEIGAWVNGRPVRKGVDRAKAAAELEKTDGEMGELTLLRTRLRYFSDGVTMAGKEFVESVFQTSRDCSGKRRKEGARRMCEGRAGLFVLRDWRGW